MTTLTIHPSLHCRNNTVQQSPQNPPHQKGVYGVRFHSWVTCHIHLCSSTSFGVGLTVSWVFPVRLGSGLGCMKGKEERRNEEIWFLLDWTRLCVFWISTWLRNISTGDQRRSIKNRCMCVCVHLQGIWKNRTENFLNLRRDRKKNRAEDFSIHLSTHLLFKFDLQFSGIGASDFDMDGSWWVGVFFLFVLIDWWVGLVD